MDTEDRPSTGERLRSERNVWLATTRPDGRPHLVPIWFVYVGSCIWIGTGRDSVKAQNIGSNPAVSVALEDGNDPVVIEGRAVLHETDRPDDVVTAFHSKYCWDVTVPEDSDVGTLVLLEVTPKKWLFG